MEERKLVTVKMASQLTGASRSFFRQLIREHKLRKFKINTAVYVDLREFEKLAQPEVA
jgi:hypothetical protein